MDPVRTALVDFRRTAMSSRRVMAFDDAHKVIVSLLDAVLSLERARVVHLNLKLESMALDDLGRVLLLDLGDAVSLVSVFACCCRGCELGWRRACSRLALVLVTRSSTLPLRLSWRAAASQRYQRRRHVLCPVTCIRVIRIVWCMLRTTHAVHMHTHVDAPAR
jgi:hypothetical protein